MKLCESGLKSRNGLNMKLCESGLKSKSGVNWWFFLPKICL
jgi:hypothetical protein